jgi:UDP-glucuronate decarboxylase
MKDDVIITGALGFIGSHLSAHFLNAGCRVIGIDDLSTSTVKSRHAQVLLKNYKNFIFKRGEVEDPTTWKQLRDAPLNVKCLFNFACPASPVQYQRMPIKTMMTCVTGTKNILDFATDKQIRVVHASTSEVYGDPDVSPQSEQYRGRVNCYGPRACYDEGKRAAEALIYDYNAKYGTDVRMMRIFNTYGPHLSPTDGRVVSNFIAQSLANEPLTIYGDGSQTRSLCYVSDLVSAAVKLSELNINPQEPINVGNPKEFTVRHLAELIRNIVSNSQQNRSTSEIVFSPLPTDDPMQRLPAIERAQKILGWYPKVELTEGLLMAVNYMKGGY